MKILKIIAIVTLVYCWRSALSMDKERSEGRRVTFAPETKRREYERWIVPGEHTATDRDKIAAQISQYREMQDYLYTENMDSVDAIHAQPSADQQEAYKKAYDISKDQEYGRPEIRRQREENRLRQYKFQPDGSKDERYEKYWK